MVSRLLTVLENLDRPFARMIHEHFCCNRRSAATTNLRPAGSPLGPSSYCPEYASGPQGSARRSRAPSLTLPHAMGEGEGGGPTNRQE